MKHTEDWCKYTKNTRSYISQHGDHVIKLLKAICARSGKFKFIKSADVLKQDDIYPGQDDVNSLRVYKEIALSLNKYIQDYIKLMEVRVYDGDSVDYSSQLDREEHSHQLGSLRKVVKATRIIASDIGRHCRS